MEHTDVFQLILMLGESATQITFMLAHFQNVQLIYAYRISLQKQEHFMTVRDIATTPNKYMRLHTH